jgi:acyl-coenzyme A synthetase/AMP-(fatty) acid ligase
MRTGPIPAAAEIGLPLVGHADMRSVAAWRRGEPVSAGRLLADVSRAAQAMPEGGHVLNLCADRYAFAVALLAALTRRVTTLLPPATTPAVIDAMRDFAPGAAFVSDADAFAPDLPDLPRIPLAFSGAGDPECEAVPLVAGSRVAAIVFTSGSTGAPQPHAKHWAGLVRNARAEARRLGIAGPGTAILGTVPAQHMFGLESTVLLPLVTGAALTAERLFYPAEIDDAIRRVPSPRILFTTPFHLRNWLETGTSARMETIVSATAPLSETLAREVEARTGATLLEIYGCTETGQLATRRPTVSAQWRTYDGVRLREEDGRTWASGGHVEEPTALSDLIEIDSGDDGLFHLRGRAADMVNIAGKRNSLAYLNHQLAAIPGVVDGVFHFPEDARPDGVTRLVAFVVAPGLTPEAIIAALRERIDPAFLPRPLVMLESLPRRGTGKIPVEELRRLAAVAATSRTREDP